MLSVTLVGLELVLKCCCPLLLFLFADLPTFHIVGDNCDLHQKPSHQTLSRQNQEHHWFQIYAVKDRVQGLHLRDDGPTASMATLTLATFLPMWRTVLHSVKTSCLCVDHCHMPVC